MLFSRCSQDLGFEWFLGDFMWCIMHHQRESLAAWLGSYMLWFGKYFNLINNFSKVSIARRFPTKRVSSHRLPCLASFEPGTSDGNIMACRWWRLQSLASPIDQYRGLLEGHFAFRISQSALGFCSETWGVLPLRWWTHGKSTCKEATYR